MMRVCRSLPLGSQLGPTDGTRRDPAQQNPPLVVPAAWTSAAETHRRLTTCKKIAGASSVLYVR
jgi:hypothetical protein